MTIFRKVTLLFLCIKTEREVEKMRVKIYIFIIVVILLAFNAFSPSISENVDFNFKNNIASISSSAEFEIRNAMNSLGIKKISLNVFQTKLKSFERELNDLLDF